MWWHWKIHGISWLDDLVPLSRLVFQFHFLLPFDQCFEISAHLVGTDVWEWIMLCETPVIRQHLYIGVAHDILSQDIYAVIDVRLKHNGRLVAPFFAPVIVIIQDVSLAQRVQAV